jgi:16S rRNA (cytosine1402-N4)-methyltransferase
MLPQAIERLAPGGRLAVISFHSLEDRIVKRCFGAAARPALPRELPLTARQMPQPLLKLVGRATRPAAGEIAANPRARSATLRVAERSAAPYRQLQNIRIEPGARWRN